MSDEQDWRLEARLDAEDSLDRLIREVHGAVGEDVVVTHDGSRLFAYASRESALRAARRVIEQSATVTVSHWDIARHRWHQVDPPLPGQAREVEGAIDRSLDTVETRTLVCGAGNWVREALEQLMRERAGELGIKCEIVEHPHLFRTQVAFTITGPRRKLDEFREALKAEGLATLRGIFLFGVSPL